MEIRSPWLTTYEAAVYLRFEKADGTPDRKSCVRFLHTHKVPMRRRGATLLIHRDDLDSALVSVHQRKSA